MHNLLVVDDEWMIREGLEKTVPWSDWNIRLVGTAKNGKEAIDKLQKEPVEILLTDIRMPGINGIELIEHCKQQYPALKIVILTGHNEFDYAQKALRLGASDFLLKPTDFDELKKTMLAISRELLVKQSEDQGFLALLARSIIESPTKERISKLKSNPLPIPLFGIIILHAQLNYFSTFNLPNSILIDSKTDEYVYLFYGVENDNHWEIIMNEIKDCFLTKNFHADLHVSSLAKEVEQLINLYAQAEAASMLDYESNQIKLYRYRDANHTTDMQETLTYINKNLHESLNQTEIAKQLHMSNSNFSKLFKQYTGMNFVVYITTRRLEKAKTLLQSTNLKTYEIAHKTGYIESRYFSQLFKKKVGCTPREYREGKHNN